MKKFLALVLCALLAVSTLAACTGGKVEDASSEDSAAVSVDSSEESSEESGEDSSEDSSEDSVDDTTEGENGSVEFNNGYISFHYSSDCRLTESNGIPTIVHDMGYNIVVTSEPASDFYKNLTEESFATSLQPVLEAQGLAISDVIVEQMVNDNDEDVTVIGYYLTYNGAIMYQTLMVVTAGDTCQVVTLTETVDCGDLALLLFDNIKVLK